MSQTDRLVGLQKSGCNRGGPRHFQSRGLPRFPLRLETQPCRISPQAPAWACASEPPEEHRSLKGQLWDRAPNEAGPGIHL